MTRAALGDGAARICRALAWATVVLSPTQWGTRLGIAHLCVADVLIVCAALCWVTKVAARGDWRQCRRLPWQVPAFILPALLSVFAADILPLACRDAFKLIGYFVLGYLVYDDLLHHHPHRLRPLLLVLLAVLTVQVLLAFGQYLTVQEPLRVRGAFGNRNVLAGWLALALPVACGIGLYTSLFWLRLGLGFLVFLGLAVDLSAASCWAVLGVTLLIAATRNWRVFALAGLAVMLWLTLVSPRIGAFRVAGIGEPQTNEQVLFQSAAIYAPDGHAERRYPGWQAAGEMILTSPWFGVGIGNYQRNVGLYTGNKPSFTGPSEPDIQNLYLVIGASMGLPALMGFLALLLIPTLRVGGAAARVSGWQQGLYYGVMGGLSAFAITAVWHPLLERGIGLHLVLLLVLARQLAAWAEVPPDARAALRHDGAAAGV